MYGSLTFLPHSNFTVLMADISFNIACKELKIAQIVQLNQLFQLLHLVHIYGHGFYGLSRMLIRKNVNNDVGKDSPIASLCAKCEKGREAGGEGTREKEMGEGKKRRDFSFCLGGGGGGEDSSLSSPPRPHPFSFSPTCFDACHACEPGLEPSLEIHCSFFSPLRSQYLLKRIAVKLV